MHSGALSGFCWALLGLVLGLIANFLCILLSEAFMCIFPREIDEYLSEAEFKCICSRANLSVSERDIYVWERYLCRREICVSERDLCV